MRIRRFALHTIILASCLGYTALLPAGAAGSPPSLSADLTQEQALNLAARNRLALVALRADQDSAEVSLGYAGLPPNPEIEVEWDNLGGDLPADEVRETTVALRQALEIGGKPSARKNRGRSEIARLRHEQNAVWLDIAAEVRAAYVVVLAARERLTLRQEAEQIAKELAAITHELVKAGELPATEEIRAEARMAETLAETEKHRHLCSEAELALNVTLAAPADVFLTPIGELPREVSIPTREALLAGIRDLPLLALRRSESELAAADLKLEQANAWSDPSLAIGLREIQDRDGRALILGLSMPLPIFQRNQTALADARASLRKAAANEEAEAHRLRTEVLKTHVALIAADQEARTLRSEVLTRASVAAESVREGFRAGKFRYSDVLESTQTLVTLKTRHLEALFDLNLAAIALDRLLGLPAFPTAELSSSSHHRSDS